MLPLLFASATFFKEEERSPISQKTEFVLRGVKIFQGRKTAIQTVYHKSHTGESIMRLGFPKHSRLYTCYFKWSKTTGPVV